MQCTHKVLVKDTVAFVFISVDLKPFFTVLEFHPNGVTLPVQNTISYRTDETHTFELRNEKSFFNYLAVMSTTQAVKIAGPGKFRVEQELKPNHYRY